MAMKLDIGDHKRGDFIWANPENIIVKEEFRGRHKPPTEAKILKTALSMLKHGQQQPVVGRRIEGNKVLLMLGFTRMAAARLIRTGFKDAEGNKQQDKDFMLKLTITDANDQKAFESNIVENAHRNETSPVDDAYNHQVLRDRYGYKDADITRLYQYDDVAKVGRLRRLLACPEEVLDMVHEGDMGVSGALELMELPEAERADAIKKATSGGKVVASRIREQVRDHHLRDQESNGDGSGEGGEDKGNNSGPSKGKKKGKGKGGKDKGGKKRPLTVREIRVFFESLKTDTDESIKEFAATIVAWINGQRRPETMREAVDKLLDSERS